MMSTFGLALLVSVGLQVLQESVELLVERQVYFRKIWVLLVLWLVTQLVRSLLL